MDEGGAGGVDLGLVDDLGLRPLEQVRRRELPVAQRCAHAHLELLALARSGGGLGQHHRFHRVVVEVQGGCDPRIGVPVHPGRIRRRVRDRGDGGHRRLTTVGQCAPERVGGLVLVADSVGGVVATGGGDGPADPAHHGGGHRPDGDTGEHEEGHGHDHQEDDRRPEPAEHGGQRVGDGRADPAAGIGQRRRGRPECRGPTGQGGQARDGQEQERAADDGPRRLTPYPSVTVGLVAAPHEHPHTDRHQDGRHQVTTPAEQVADGDPGPVGRGHE